MPPAKRQRTSRDAAAARTVADVDSDMEDVLMRLLGGEQPGRREGKQPIAQAVGLWLFTSSPMGAAPAAASAVAPSAAPNAASRAAPPKPCACTWPGCDKRFRDNYILERHMPTHTGVRPFVCTWAGCVECFSQQSHLTTHLRTQHSAEAEALRARLARWREQQPLVCQAAAKGPLPLLQLLDGFENPLPARGISTALERALRFARRGLDSTDEPPDGDAESSVPSIADELEVSPSEDDETELDDGGAVFDEAAPELAEMSSPELMTSAGATEALGILGRLRPRLPLGKTLAAEVARLEVDLHRVILIQATLAAAASAGAQDREAMPSEARARAEALRARFVGRASTLATVSEAVGAAVAVVGAVEAAVEGLAQVEMAAAWAAAAEAGRVCVAAACTLVRCERHTAYPEAAGEDLEQEALRARSPDDRMFGLGSLVPSNPAAWKGIGRGAKALYGQFVRLPDGVALPAHLLDCPGCYVRLKAGDDIVAACQPFAEDIGEHARRLELADADRERIIALNMSACITVCGLLETQSGAAFGSRGLSATAATSRSPRPTPSTARASRRRCTTRCSLGTFTCRSMGTQGALAGV